MGRFILAPAFLPSGRPLRAALLERDGGRPSQADVLAPSTIWHENFPRAAHASQRPGWVPRDDVYRGPSPCHSNGGPNVGRPSSLESGAPQTTPSGLLKLQGAADK